MTVGVGLVDALGALAAVATLAAFAHRTIVPMRITAIAANLCFIGYGALGSVYPVLALHLILLPLNIGRLAQALRPPAGDCVVIGPGAMPGLAVRCPSRLQRIVLEPGEVLYRRGEAASAAYGLVSGAVEAVEPARRASAGALVGFAEILGAHDGRRRETCRALERTEMVRIPVETLKRLLGTQPALAECLIAAQLDPAWPWAPDHQDARPDPARQVPGPDPRRQDREDVEAFYYPSCLPAPEASAA